ncbi:MAG: septum formation protein Maf [Anaerolineaceae bacterium 4572_78]|nr:MAG: septum formation protein Maf [Anaerolineaceae bacterium 4572_78]
MIKYKNKIILASASPRRQSLLSMLDIPFTVHVANIDETPLPNETPTSFVRRLSLEKAKAITQYHDQAIIIGADTIVLLDKVILGKPATHAEARNMLRNLRGREHVVYSTVTVFDSHTKKHYTTLSKSIVTMRLYTDVEIEHYVVSGSPMDKAGAYAIQDSEFAPVSKLDGCYAGVMGFPLGHLAQGLIQFGIKLTNIEKKCADYTGKACCLSCSTGKIPVVHGTMS